MTLNSYCLPGWCTKRENVALLHDDALPGQPLQVGGDYGGVVPGHIVVPKIISKDKDDVGLGGSQARIKNSNTKKNYG